MTPAPHEVTGLLKRWSEGDESARERLMPLVYDKLRQLAHQHMRREKPGHMLQTTALVHEAYLRLIDQSQVHFENRAHFFGIAARLMRQILVDDARRRKGAKRGGGMASVALDEASNLAPEEAANVLALDEALTLLAEKDRRQSEIVELRFFGGLSVEETAEVLKVSPQTVMRDWRLARVWRKSIMRRPLCTLRAGSVWRVTDGFLAGGACGARPSRRCYGRPRWAPVPRPGPPCPRSVATAGARCGPGAAPAT